MKALPALVMPLFLSGCAAIPEERPAGEGPVIAFGDSYTEGFGTTRDRKC